MYVCKICKSTELFRVKFFELNKRSFGPVFFMAGYGDSPIWCDNCGDFVSFKHNIEKISKEQNNGKITGV